MDGDIQVEHNKNWCNLKCEEFIFQCGPGGNVEDERRLPEQRTGQLPTEENSRENA